MAAVDLSPALQLRTHARAAGYNSDQPASLTAPLPPLAVEALHRMELALAEQTVANFDTHGSLWGYDTVETADAEIAESLAEAATAEEWETTDRDGQPLRVMRVVHPKWGTDIRVTSTWPAAARRAATLRGR